ncbi:hypothetical protein SNE40_014679 [Patella caerulea]|uniref:Uncharacterized protein n=1 Tax=Patella caerulea TaxID=87958 RepID=A0AAN8PQW9_PATCE
MPGLVLWRNTENEEMCKVLFEERKMNYFNDFQNIMVDNCVCSACKYLRRKPTSGRSRLINDMDIESKTISKPDYSTLTHEQMKNRKVFRSKSLDLSLDSDALSMEKTFGSIISFDLLKEMIHCFKLNLLLTKAHFGLENRPHKYTCTLKSLAQAKLLELERTCSNSFKDNTCSSGTFQSEKNCVDEPFNDYKIGFVDETREDDSDVIEDDKNCAGNKDSARDSDNSWNIWNGNTIQLKIPGSSEESSKRQLPRMSYQYLLFSRGNISARSKFFKFFTETKGFLGHTGNSCLCCNEGRKKPLYQR